MMTNEQESCEREFNNDLAVARLKPILHDIGEKVIAIRDSSSLSVQTKKDFADIVTQADTLAEKLIADHIKQFYPYHSIRGEEGTNVKSSSGYEWIIDPIDGTINFVSGMDLFGISVAMYHNGKGELGVMYFPALGKLAYAIRGQGAFVNDQQILIVKSDKTLKESLIAAGLIRGTEDLFSKLRTNSRNVLAGGCFTAESLWLIEGKIDAYVHTGATPYDLAAARIIVEEVGGVSSGIKNNGINLNDEQIPIILAKSQGLVGELQVILN
ncbi:inositol monophosphatase family protein [Candidatus Woesearchaeota archaeon]|nr:inositol monophosphatase family protein [Candidatus Woesearchaeota archaeon]